MTPTAKPLNPDYVTSSRERLSLPDQVKLLREALNIARMQIIAFSISNYGQDGALSATAHIDKVLRATIPADQEGN